VIEDVLYAAMCWTLGYVSVLETDRMVRWALWFQRRFPEAFSSRLAERAWYPRFVRTLGIVLLVLAAIFTLKITARLIAFH
jgi:hypothetical protein